MSKILHKYHDFGPIFDFPVFTLTLTIPFPTEISCASDISDLYERASKQ